MSKGLIVEVFRSARSGGSTNGATAYAQEVLITGENIDQVFDAQARPEYHLARGPLGQPIAIPAEYEGVYAGRLMFGGNFLSSSDSRFGEAAREISQYHRGPVMVFDRDESKPFSTMQYFAFVAKVTEGESSRPIFYAAAIEAGVEPESALDMVLCDDLADGDRDGASDSLQSRCGCVAMTPVRATPISFQEYEALMKVGIARRRVTVDVYEVWAREQRGDKDAFVIYAQLEDLSGVGESGYWDETLQQWGGLASATRYTRNDRLRIRSHRMPQSKKAQAGMDASSFVAVSSIVAQQLKAA